MMKATWFDKNRHLIFIFLLSITVVGAAAFYLSRPEPAPIEIMQIETVEPTATPLPTATSTPSPVRVFVTGAVAQPDVYFLPSGSIIKDAVLAAGGFTEEADREGINQALELKDQQQIYIPRLGEETPLPAVQGGVSGANTQQPMSEVQPGEEIGKVNLNAASLDQLMTLPRIGPVIGQRIIDYREQIGGFESIEQVVEVSGIGDATYAKIKDMIRVE